MGPFFPTASFKSFCKDCRVAVYAEEISIIWDQAVEFPDLLWSCAGMKTMKSYTLPHPEYWTDGISCSPPILKNNVSLSPPCRSGYKK